MRQFQSEDLVQKAKEAIIKSSPKSSNSFGQMMRRMDNSHIKQGLIPASDDYLELARPFLDFWAVVVHGKMPPKKALHSFERQVNDAN